MDSMVFCALVRFGCAGKVCAVRESERERGGMVLLSAGFAVCVK